MAPGDAIIRSRDDIQRLPVGAVVTHMPSGHDYTVVDKRQGVVVAVRWVVIKETKMVWKRKKPLRER